MYEPRTKPLISGRDFFVRVVSHGMLAVAAVLFALTLGIVGYHVFEGLPWIDATLNASMILGGMGPVDKLSTESGKIFVSAYALFSGIVFIAIMGLLLAPFVHRLMHRFHLDED